MPLKLSILSYWPTFGVPFTLLETSIDCLKNQLQEKKKTFQWILFFDKFSVLFWHLY